MLQVRHTGTSDLRRSLTLRALALLLLSGCAAQGLAFKQDTRVEVVAPADRSAVSVPFDVRWTVRDFDTRPGQGSFGVLVDRAPPEPGRTLESLVEKEVGCRREDGCPDAPYLADRSIYRTTETFHRVERLRDVGVEGRRERHEVTIVLLDGAGRRTSEAAFSVEFEVTRVRNQAGLQVLIDA